MELQQIKYFRIIAQTENISKAAEQLFIAQPSLSQMLKRLEVELGQPLFDRNGKKIVLNPAGKIFLKYCDEIISSLEHAERELNELKGSDLSDINIAVESASLLIPEIVEQLRHQFPQIMPHIFQSEVNEWDLKIHSDISAMHGPSSTLLLKEPIGIVMPAEHPLSGKSQITKPDLQDYAFISLSSNCNLYKIISYFCEKVNFTPHISMYVDSPSIMRDLLNMNLGIAFVPQYTWHRFYDGALEFRTIADIPISRYVHLTVNERNYVTNAVKKCQRTITDYFTEYTRKFQ